MWLTPPLSFSLSLPSFPGSEGGVREEETQAERGLCAVRRPPGVRVHVAASSGGELRGRNRYIQFSEHPFTHLFTLWHSLPAFLHSHFKA